MKCTPQKTMVDSLRFGGLVGQAERITDVVGHALDVLALVVVREDEGVLGLLEGDDFLLQCGAGASRRRAGEGRRRRSGR
jgi:hypothetical protein